MKFLNPAVAGGNIMPLNIYYERSTDYKTNDDTLLLIYKDMDTGKKYVESIVNPVYEVWITKEEYRDYNYMKDWIERDKCYPVKVHYRTRNAELGKVLGIPSETVKYSPYIFGYDIRIEHFYMIQFLLEYGNSIPKKLSISFLDIENDIVQVEGFPVPGEAPINMVTVMDIDSMTSYSFILRKDNLPNVSPTHRDYEKLEGIRNDFYRQFDEFEQTLPQFIQELHETNDESYGVLDYKFLIFEDEMDLLRSLWEVIRALDNDFLEIWNEPYDMQHMIERPKVFGVDPDEIIPNIEFARRQIEFVEDRNPLAHKRKHVCKTYTTVVITDDMKNYAGVRSARGKIPSLKLNAIARRELGEGKIDYSEEGSIKWLFYRNLKKFIAYNIRDVALQVGIEMKTRDTSNVYQTMYTNGVLVDEVFTSTINLTNSIRLFGWKYKEGYVFGSNRSKTFKLKGNEFIKIVDKYIQDNYGVVGALRPEMADDEEERDLEDMLLDENAYFAMFEDDVEDDEEMSETKRKKKDKYTGAFVMHPDHQQSTGFEMYGAAMKYIHEHVVDQDITSEYPTAIMIMNACNEALVGKVFFPIPDEIKVEMYPMFNFKGNERADYKLELGTFVMETYTTGDVFNMASTAFQLPTPSEVMDGIANDLSRFVA